MTSLRKRMIEDMQVRNRSPHTQASYVQQVSLFAQFFDKSPELLGPEDIRTYQVFLTNEKRLTPKSISVAVAALRFLYNVSSKRNGRLTRFSHIPNNRRSYPSSSAPAFLWKGFST